MQEMCFELTVGPVVDADAGVPLGFGAAVGSSVADGRSRDRKMACTSGDGIRGLDEKLLFVFCGGNAGRLCHTIITVRLEIA